MATQPITAAVVAVASNVAAPQAAAAPAQGIAANPPAVLAAAETPLTTNVPAPPSITGTGASPASGTPATPASTTAITPPTKPFPEAMLTALLQAKRNLDQLSKTARQNAHTTQYNSIVALSTVADEATFLSKFTVIEQADKAFRQQQAKEEETADKIERSGVLLIEMNPDAAAAVERSLRGQAQQHAQSNQERILRAWEKKAGGEKKSRAAKKSKAGKKAKVVKKAKAKGPRGGRKGP